MATKAARARELAVAAKEKAAAAGSPAALGGAPGYVTWGTLRRPNGATTTFKSELGKTVTFDSTTESCTETRLQPAPRTAQPALHRDTSPSLRSATDPTPGPAPAPAPISARLSTVETAEAAASHADAARLANAARLAKLNAAQVDDGIKLDAVESDNGIAISVEGMWKVEGETSDGAPITQWVQLQQVDEIVFGSHVESESTDGEEAAPFAVQGGSMKQSVGLGPARLTFRQCSPEGWETAWVATVLPDDEQLESAMVMYTSTCPASTMVGSWSGHVNGVFSATRVTEENIQELLATPRGSVAECYYKCDQCEFRGKTENEVRRHQGLEHPFFGCIDCDFKANTEREVREHQLASHPVGVGRGKPLFKCYACAYRGYTEEDVRTHQVRPSTQAGVFGSTDSQRHAAPLSTVPAVKKGDRTDATSSTQLVLMRACVLQALAHTEKVDLDAHWMTEELQKGKAELKAIMGETASATRKGLTDGWEGAKDSLGAFKAQAIHGAGAGVKPGAMPAESS